jgi:hypothetical protein
VGYKLLNDLGAPPKLILHVQLVNEAAEQLIVQLEHLGISIDRQWIILSVAFHDTGRILHPEELIAKGNHHEAAGEDLLLNHEDGDRSHGDWARLLGNLYGYGWLL